MIIQNLFHQLFVVIQNRTQKYGIRHYMFSIFAMLIYMATLLIKNDLHNSAENLLILLRVIASVLCLVLCSVDYWPINIRIKYFPVYWYATLCFCLPFLSI